MIQSERGGRHAKLIKQLLADGHVYHSTQTKADVDASKAEHGAERGFRGTANS